MDYIYLKARAKINVALDVLSKRDDGYHNLRMVMQTLALYDGVFIKKLQTDTIKLCCNSKWLPTDERNLAYTAAKFLINKFQIQNGVFIELTKNIPVSAGLAGGSSDCAATLVGMRKIFNLPLTDEELRVIGKQFGADVPFCLMRGTALAEGIGEILTPLAPHPKVWVLLAKPPIGIPTASVFKKLDLSTLTVHPDIDKIVKGLKRGDLSVIAKNMYNVLENVTTNNHPEIIRLKEIMLNYGAQGAIMSGSGPTVFGYFTCKDDALEATRNIKKFLPFIKEIHLTTVYNPHLRSKVYRSKKRKLRR